MKLDYEIQDRAIQQAFKRSPQTMKKAVNKGLDQAALILAEAAKAQIKANKSMGVSDLIRSVTFKKGMAFERIVFAGVKHAYFVEEGSKGGSMPPTLPLLRWLRVKNGLSEEEAKRRVFPLARHIKENGVQAKPFMQPAFTENESKLIQILEASITQGIEASFGLI